VSFFTFCRISWLSLGSFDKSQIVSNLKFSIFILFKYFSIEFTSLIIAFTSSSSLFCKLSTLKAQSVKYFIQILSAYSVIFTTLSAQALCPIIFGNPFSLAHLLFQSIIIHKCFGIFFDITFLIYYNIIEELRPLFSYFLKV
jgi:hypothetical protein